MPKHEGETVFTTLKRLHRLVEFLLDKSKYGAAFEEIAEEIYDYYPDCDRQLSSVRRMFNRDLRSLMELYDDEEPYVDEDGNVDEESVVIEKKRVDSKDRYFIKNGFHFIMPMKLTQDQATALAFGLRVTEEMVGPFASLSGALWEKLKHQFPKDFIDGNNKLIDSIVSVIPVGSPASTSKREYAMRKIADAIQRGKAVKISYTHGDGTNSSYKFSPYVLSLKYHSWYVVGETDSEQRTVRLDRINSVEVLDEDQPHPRDGDDLKRLKRAIRLDVVPSLPYALYHVKLRITGSFVQPCMETRWFPNEKKTKQDDGSLLYEVNLKGLEWITLWIMRALDCMEVLEPAELRDEIDRRVDAYSARRSATDV